MTVPASRDYSMEVMKFGACGAIDAADGARCEILLIARTKGCIEPLFATTDGPLCFDA